MPQSKNNWRVALPLVSLTVAALFIGAISTTQWSVADLRYGIESEYASLHIHQIASFGFFKACINTDASGTTGVKSDICVSQNVGVGECPAGTKSSSSNHFSGKIFAARGLFVSAIIVMFLTAAFQLLACFKQITRNDTAVAVVLAGTGVVAALLAVVVFYAAVNNVCGGTVCTVTADQVAMQFKTMDIDVKVASSCSNAGASMIVFAVALMIGAANVVASGYFVPRDAVRVVMNLSEREDRAAHRAELARARGAVTLNANQDDDDNDLLADPNDAAVVPPSLAVVDAIPLPSKPQQL